MPRPRGFTIIEVLATFGILVIGIVAAQIALTQGITAATRNVNEFIAAHLAEEGLELVRNIRDNNWASGGSANWDHNMEAGRDGD